MQTRGIAVLSAAFVLGTASWSFGEHVDMPLVSASPQHLRCLFNPACAPVPSTSTVTTFTVPGAAGEGRLEVRTFQGAPGSPAAGLFGYEYRLDLSQTYGILNVPCVTTLGLPTGWPSNAFDLDGDGASGDRLYIVNGPLGSPYPTAAEKWDNVIWFYFENPVCAGSSPGHGDTTLAFGLVSAKPPTTSQARLKTDPAAPGGFVLVDSRTPELAQAVKSSLKLAEYFVAQLPLDGFPWPPNANDRRRHTLLTRLARAASLAEEGQVRAARLTLERLRSLVDGGLDDWVVDLRHTREDERAILLSLIDLAIDGLEPEQRIDQR